MTDHLLPFGGLLGDTPRIRVIEELIAEMNTPLTADQVSEMADVASVIEADAILSDLVDCGFAIRLQTFPTTYVLNPESRRGVALTLLAYAHLDDANPGDEIMVMVMRSYLAQSEGNADVY